MTHTTQHRAHSQDTNRDRNQGRNQGLNQAGNRAGSQDLNHLPATRAPQVAVTGALLGAHMETHRVVAPMALLGALPGDALGILEAGQGQLPVGRLEEALAAQMAVLLV